MGNLEDFTFGRILALFGQIRCFRNPGEKFPQNFSPADLTGIFQPVYNVFKGLNLTKP